jgi:DNA primase
MPGIDYRQLRRQITMSRVLDLLGFQPTGRRGPQLRGPCPLPDCHSASRQPFSVHLARQIYHCFACHSHGNPLDLWAAVRRLPLHDAALDLCHAANLVPPRLPTSHLIPEPHQSSRVASRAPSRNR